MHGFQRKKGKRGVLDGEIVTRREAGQCVKCFVSMQSHSRTLARVCVCVCQDSNPSSRPPLPCRRVPRRHCRVCRRGGAIAKTTAATTTTSSRHCISPPIVNEKKEAGKGSSMDACVAPCDTQTHIPTQNRQTQAAPFFGAVSGHPSRREVRIWSYALHSASLQQRKTVGCKPHKARRK